MDDTNQKKTWADAIAEFEAEAKAAGVDLEVHWVEDGFGSMWSSECETCGGKTTVDVVRPGKAQCCICGTNY